MGFFKTHNMTHACKEMGFILAAHLPHYTIIDVCSPLRQQGLKHRREAKKGTLQHVSEDEILIKIHFCYLVVQIRTGASPLLI